ncbi:MAG: transporter substrate-binding domain-containing protein [Lachnospiraceae bacterium]|nr:transporter substrate-binding domain-containing protein [Lachnospiraceae bacterium]
MRKSSILRIMALALCVILSLGLLACGSSDNSAKTTASSGENANPSGESKDLLARIRERGTLVIGTEGNWSPWTYHDEKDNLVGLDIEIGTKLAEKIGVKPDFQETDWDAILAGVDSGRFDIACNGVGYTEARAEKYNFSTPYVYTHKVLVVSGDNEDIKKMEDLKGKTTANSPGSTYAEIAESYGATVTSASTLDQTIELLLEGRVDATVNAQVSIEDYLSQHPDANIKVVQVLEGDPVAFPMQKTDDAKSLVDEVNKILDEMRKDGSLKDISMKYFKLDLTKED